MPLKNARHEHFAQLVAGGKSARDAYVAVGYAPGGAAQAAPGTLYLATLATREAYLTVGDSKTEAGEGRTIPLNSLLLKAMVDYSKWYTRRFGAMQPEWYVFAFGKPRPADPTRPMVTLNTSWNNVRRKANVKGRWHDNRHTLITDLAESGAADETIRAIAGHVSPQMLRHYSHIRMEAKRAAVEAIVRQTEPRPAASDNPVGVEPPNSRRLRARTQGIRS
jgi:site-specific recombinase XerD